jgi:uncharacterized protein YbjT (DUF2867 family)
MPAGNIDDGSLPEKLVKKSVYPPVPFEDVAEIVVKAVDLGFWAGKGGKIKNPREITVKILERLLETINEALKKQ